MVVPFGVSIGDFVSTLGLIRKVIAALAQSHGSAAQYRELLARLDSLESALKQLETLEWDDDEERIAESLEKVTERFTQSIQKFHLRIAKFHKLGIERDGNGSWWKQDAFRKIQFTFIKDDIQQLEVDLLMHASSLHIILETAKASAMKNMQKEFQEMQKRMASAEAKLDETYMLQQSFKSAFVQCASEIRSLLMAVLSSLMTSRGASSLAMPRQICFDEPLTLQDACGKYFPVHLEWTNCWEAFYNVLQIQFKDRPGQEAVRARAYKLQDGSVPGEWKEVDVEKPYGEVFKAGGRWDQLMVFPYDPDAEAGCPRCGRPEAPGVNPNRVECRNPACSLSYSRAADVWGEVLSLPPHFEMPSNVGIDLAQEEAESAASHEASDTTIKANEEPADLGFAENPDTEGGEHLGCPGPTHLRLDDFANVYFGRSPPVYLRDLDGAWFLVPWPVFQSYEGMQFLADHFFSRTIANAEIWVKDWSFGNEVGRHNWKSSVYFGMVAEMVSTGEGGAVGAQPRAFTQATQATQASPTFPCHLCAGKFYTRASLGKHVKTHLRNSLCPSACTICNVL